MALWPIAQLVLAAWLVGPARAFLPVLMMHGFSFTESQGTFHDFDHFVEWIEAAHPGTLAISLDINNGVDSMRPLWPQLHELQSLVEQIVAANETAFENGFHVIGHSQGGLLTRSLLEQWTGHRCQTYISMAGVQMGQYGIGPLQQWIPLLAEEEATDLLYETWWQDHWSAANFWHTPLFDKRFLAENIYLPVLDNLVQTQSSKLYKSNFARIKRVVLLGSPADGTLVPWFTAHFAFWDRHMQFVPREQQDVYVNDTFGLRTLQETGRLVAFSVEGVKHAHWLSNKTAFDTYILPELY